MAILGFEFDEIARVISLLETSGLEEIVWEEENRYLTAVSKSTAPASLPLSRNFTPQALPPPVAQRALPRKPKTAAASSGKTAALALDQVALESPMVGVFYRSGKPSDPPFIEVGQTVVKGQVVGILEAMKIFSEVEAEHSGVAVSCPAKDGQLVQAGTPLIILKRS